MSAGLVIEIDDLLGHPEREREFSGVREVDLRLGDSVVSGEMSVAGMVVGTVDGVQVTFTATAVARLACVRCLKEWEETLSVSGSQHFGSIPDEDGYAIERGRVDLAGPASDEIALAIPAAPRCRIDCRGLCPICGTDLNSDPCDGHGDESDSPFTVLKDLFES
ncbi:MAG: DUF177 domain-containing protein [Acidimicrobiia bacterium]